VYRDPATATEFVYVTGYFNFDAGGPAEFGDPANPGDTGAVSLTSLGGVDAFVSKLTAAGNFLWTRQFGGTGGDGAYDLAVDAAGAVYSTGLFGSPACDFDLNKSYPDNHDILANGGVYVAKLDAAGNFAWARRLGPPPGSNSGGAISF